VSLWWRERIRLNAPRDFAALSSGEFSGAVKEFDSELPAALPPRLAVSPLVQ
jgi:hypothetical protein